jgi:hypothetical protein
LQRLASVRQALGFAAATGSAEIVEQTARILERQNVLQTSQVLFRRICVSLAMVLPFKDSAGGTWSYSILIGVISAGTRQ